MGIFNLFKRTPERPPFDLSILKVDMHSHLIPGIDDGSKSLDSTIAMLSKMRDLGYKKIITTPHILSDYYKNTPEIILNGLEVVKAEIRRINLDIEFEAAAEYYFDENFIQQIQKKNILTFGDNYVLFEFGFRDEPTNIDSLLFSLQSNGFSPVLAHFERYAYWCGSVREALEFRERGVKIQLNLNSLAGHYGPEIKKQAERLIDAKCVDFVGTDCHRIEHLLILEQHLSSEYMHKLSDCNLLNNQL